MLDEEGLESAVLLPLDVLQVIRVDDADDVVELVRPALPMVVPVEVLRLLQDRDVSFLGRDELRGVPGGEDAPPLLLKLETEQKNRRKNWVRSSSGPWVQQILGFALFVM